MEIINWIEHEEKGNYKRPNLVAYALLESMVSVSDNIKDTFAPFNSQALDVCLTVNGKQVSFVRAMELIQEGVERLEDQIRKDIITDAAQALIDDLQDMIHTEQWNKPNEHLHNRHIPKIRT